ncbi:brevican core protein-like [Lytechinus variegatus]|uniref:brevican core protein-like n=1 Tax=Lytechinus variegatus TaxID=7654 RepID=UPI001BB1178C|nr:brevican core protein-like [Lytechinus variegatus]
MTHIAMTTRGNEPCSDGFDLNYTIPMFEICPGMLGEDGEMRPTIPKIIPAYLTQRHGCENQPKKRLSGKRICRIPATLPRSVTTTMTTRQNVDTKNITSTSSPEPETTSPKPQTTLPTIVTNYTSQVSSTLTSNSTEAWTTTFNPNISQPTIVTNYTSQVSSNITSNSTEAWTTIFQPNTSQPSLDACFFKPCRNGGTCSTTAPSVYKCTCNAGHTGTHCEFSICPKDWFYYGNKCYVYLSQNRTWGMAIQACSSLTVQFYGETVNRQPSMLLPESQDEADEMAQRFPGADGAGRIWINCNDRQTEGVWICETDANGTISNYRNWYRTEPNGDGDTAYLVNHYIDQAKWFDFNQFSTVSTPQTVCQVIL